MAFEDRTSTYPNRYLLTDENGNTSYVVLERADEPTNPGTPLNAETLNPKNVLDAVLFTLGTENSSVAITDHVVRKHNVIYSPIAGVVFFDLLLTVAFDGTWEAGSAISMQMGGLYPPAGQIVLSCYGGQRRHFSAFLDAYGKITIKSHEDITLGANIVLSGWYFCEGE